MGNAALSSRTCQSGQLGHRYGSSRRPCAANTAAHIASARARLLNAFRGLPLRRPGG